MYSRVNQAMQTASIISRKGWGSITPLSFITCARAMSALIHIQESPWAPGWCWGPSPQWTPARRTSRCRRQCLQQYYWQMLVSIKPPPAASDESGCSIRSQIHFWYLNSDLCYKGSKWYNCHLPRQLSLNFSGASSCMSTHWASISWAFCQCQDVRWK